MFSKQTLSSKIAIGGLLVLAILLGNLKFSQWRKQKQVQKEKQNLQQQNDDLFKETNELNQSLQYLSSPNFKERVAREQLDLKKADEQVFSFTEVAQAQIKQADPEAGQPSNNAKRWWDYFFTN